MSTLRYKEFQGSVEFDESVLVIEILHIDDLVTTEITDASLAQAAFEDLVEDYLASCAELGKEPCRPFKGSFNVRISRELHRQVAMAAADANESMNSWVSQALEARAQQQKSKRPPINQKLILQAFTQRSSNKYSAIRQSRQASVRIPVPLCGKAAG